MTEREIDVLVVRTMAGILRHVGFDGDDVFIAQEGLDVLRTVLIAAYGESTDRKEG